MSCYENPETKVETDTALSGTRWNSGGWDYTIGDDYVIIYEDGVEYIFYSSTHGVRYEWSKVLDSDFGNSHSRKLSFFSYQCKGSDVELTFIVPTNLSTKTLILENGRLSETNGMSYSKVKFDRNTAEWLSGNHGTSGDCEWYYDLESTLVISGDGNMADYSSWEATPWSKLAKWHAINKVELIGDVKNIGNYAFSSPSIAEASLSSKIESIGVGAFSGSTLGSIWIPSSVKDIKADAFAHCKYLKDISCMYNVETIGDAAFTDCKSISLSLCKKIRSIGKFAFEGCNVKSFTPSEELVSIETGAFTNCSFSTLKLPNSVEYLGHDAFSCTTINKIEIGTGLKSVSGIPFYVASSGTLFVDKNTPIDLTSDFIETSSKWTLRIPKGSKNAYSKASYWKNFKNIIEDSTLAGDGTTPPENPDESEDDSEDDSKYHGSLLGHDWVDLGLSVKWATANVDSSSPTSPGEYYNWKRSTTDWETDAVDSVGENWSGNVSQDPLTKLWGYQLFGSKWQTPTKVDFEELISNCTFSKVAENGVTCIKAVSKINSQYILIPLSGCKDGCRDYGETTDKLNSYGKIGYLWSASSESKNGQNIAYYFVVDINSATTPRISYRSLCQNIYTYYSRIPLRGVCK